MLEVTRLSQEKIFQPILKRPDTRTILRGKPRIVQCFVDADCRLQIPGLVQLCLDNGIKVEDLGKCQLIPFINHARNLIKVLACNGTPNPVMGVYRLPQGRIYDLAIIGEIPSAFKADGHIDFDQAMRQAIEKYFARKKAQRLDLEIVNKANSRHN